MRVFRYPLILTRLRPDLPRLALGLLCAIAAALAALVPLIAVVEYLESPHRYWPAVAAAGVVIAGLLGSSASLLAHDAEARFELRLRTSLAQQVSRLPITTLHRLSGGDIRARLSDDVSALHHLIAHLPAEFAVMIAAPTATVAVLLYYCGPIALVVLVPAVCAAVVRLVVVPRLSTAVDDDRRTAVRDIVGAVDDFTRGITVTRIFGAQAGARQRYDDATRTFSDRFRQWVSRVSIPAAVASGILVPATTLAVAALVGIGRSTTELAALLVFSVATTAPVLRLGHGLDYVSAGTAAAARIEELLAETALQEPISPTPVRGRRLEARGVTVVVDDRTILDDVDVTIEPDTFTAVTGTSGSGKTTLLRVLGRALDPTVGAASIGGTDYTEIELGAMPRHVVTVPQNPTVLPRSIRENLLLAVGSDGASDDLLRRALRTAHLSVDLESFAESLSGGERQRLAIARALLTDAPTILLDEPTSALDDATARALVRNLAALTDRTVVMVTHDPALAALASRTIHIDNGRICA